MSSRAEVLDFNAKSAGLGLPGAPYQQLRFDSRMAFHRGLAELTGESRIQELRPPGCDPCERDCWPAQALVFARPEDNLDIEIHAPKAHGQTTVKTPCD